MIVLVLEVFVLCKFFIRLFLRLMIVLSSLGLIMGCGGVFGGVVDGGWLVVGWVGFCGCCCMCGCCCCIVEGLVGGFVVVVVSGVLGGWVFVCWCCCGCGGLIWGGFLFFVLMIEFVGGVFCGFVVNCVL